MKQSCIVYILVPCIFQVCFAHDADLRVAFTKIESRSSTSDTTEGTIFSSGGALVVAVSSPLVQYMLIDTLSTLIYNPDEGRAIRIRQKARSFLPFFHTFVGFFKGDQAIPVTFFRIGDTRKNGDTLVTTWVPKDRKNNLKGHIETVYYKDLPLRTSSIDHKGRVVSRMEFSNDSLVRGRHVPFKIVTYTANGADTVREEVLFRDLAMGAKLPDSLRNMTVPPRIPITELEW